MPRLLLQMEGHNVEAVASLWTGMITIKVDGAVRVKKFAVFGQEFAMEVGGKPLKITVSALGTIQVYADGRLIASS